MSGLSIAFRQISVGGVVWHVPENDTQRMIGWLHDHFPAILDNEICLIKKDLGRRVAVAAGLVVKETTRRHGRSVIRFGFRRSASRGSFHVARSLIAKGVPVPMPVAWATDRRWGLRVTDYIVTEQIAGCRSLTSILKAVPDNGILRRPVVEGMGELLGLFHRSGYSNRDLKDGNILVEDKGSFKLWAVDLDGVRRSHLRIGGLQRDFRAILRSLGLHGWATEDDRRTLLGAYNDSVPSRLRLRRLPRFKDWTPGCPARRAPGNWRSC